MEENVLYRYLVTHEDDRARETARNVSPCVCANPDPYVSGDI